MTGWRKGASASNSNKLNDCLMILLEVIVFGTLIVMSFIFCNIAFSLLIVALSFVYALKRMSEEDKRVVGNE